jgi:hypothetical protein
MTEFIAALCISLAGFSLTTFLLLRFTTIPGFRVWIFAVFGLLSYPVAAGYVGAASWLCGFLPELLLDHLSGATLFRCVLFSSLVTAPVFLWLLFRYGLAVRQRPVRMAWLVAPACVVFITTAYLKISAVPDHEFDEAWYRNPRQWSEQEAAGFASSHRSALVCAEADHLVSPVGPSRAVRLMHASRDPSGDVFLRFISRQFSSSADLHLLPVYCWSAQQDRLVWKALEDHSP